MLNWKQFALLMCATLMLGCSGAGSDPPAVRVTPAPPPALKSLLESVAASGELGSGAQELAQEFEKLKQADAAKAESLSASFNQLLASEGKPDAVKKLAAEIAGKL